MNVTLIRQTKREFTFAIDNYWTNCIIFDLRIVPFRPTPKRIAFEYRSRRGRVQRWSMSWKKFLREKAIGDTIIIKRANFRYSQRLLNTEEKS